MKPCLTCGTPTQRTRCPACTRGHDQTRRPSPRQRGYDQQYRKARAALLATNPACVRCGAPATTADHIVPLALGGSSHPGNLQPMCKPCNSGKGARTGP